MATHATILVWEIPWTEELGGLQSMGSQRVGQDWATKNEHKTLETPGAHEGPGVEGSRVWAWLRAEVSCPCCYGCQQARFKVTVMGCVNERGVRHSRFVLRWETHTHTHTHTHLREVREQATVADLATLLWFEQETVLWGQIVPTERETTIQ